MSTYQLVRTCSRHADCPKTIPQSPHGHLESRRLFVKINGPLTVLRSTCSPRDDKGPVIRTGLGICSLQISIAGLQIEAIRDFRGRWFPREVRWSTPFCNRIPATQRWSTDYIRPLQPPASVWISVPLGLYARVHSRIRAHAGLIDFAWMSRDRAAAGNKRACLRIKRRSSKSAGVRILHSHAHVQRLSWILSIRIRCRGRCHWL